MVEKFAHGRLGMVPRDWGDFIRFSDYASLQKELAERTKERDRFREQAALECEAQVFAKYEAEKFIVRTNAAEARADALAQEVERLKVLLIRASVGLEPFAKISSMLSFAGATETDEVELSGDQLRAALIAAQTIKAEIDAALGDRP